MVFIKKVLSIFAAIAITLIMASTDITITRTNFQELGDSFTPHASPHAASRQLRGGTPNDVSNEMVNEELIAESVNTKDAKQILWVLAEQSKVTKDAIAVPVGSTSGGDGLSSVPAQVQLQYDDMDWEVHEGGANPIDAEEAMAALILAQWQLNLLILVIQLIFAYLYWDKVVSKIRGLQGGHHPDTAHQEDFTHGICSCCEDSSICCHTCCCFACRVAHNTHVMGIMNYWPAIGAMCLSNICANCCVPICLQTYFRMETRKKLGLRADGFMDCVCTCCCAPCAIAQASREVDQKLGATVQCPFKLQQTPAPVMEAPQQGMEMSQPHGGNTGLDG